MKSVTMIGALVLALAGIIAFAAAPRAALSADPTTAKIAALQRQVKTLQTQVKSLRRTDVNLKNQLGLNFEGDTCLGAQVADLIQGTWGVLDEITQALQQKTTFGPQVPVTDYDNCHDLTGPDVPRPGIRVPPTIDPLRPLLQWVHE